jgi:hypothetical protein
MKATQDYKSYVCSLLLCGLTTCRRWRIASYSSLFVGRQREASFAYKPSKFESLKILHRIKIRWAVAVGSVSHVIVKNSGLVSRRT